MAKSRLSPASTQVVRRSRALGIERQTFFWRDFADRRRRNIGTKTPPSARNGKGTRTIKLIVPPFAIQSITNQRAGTRVEVTRPMLKNCETVVVWTAVTGQRRGRGLRGVGISVRQSG